MVVQEMAVAVTLVLMLGTERPSKARIPGCWKRDNESAAFKANHHYKATIIRPSYFEAQKHRFLDLYA